MCRRKDTAWILKSEEKNRYETKIVIINAEKLTSDVCVTTEGSRLIRERIPLSGLRMLPVPLR